MHYIEIIKDNSVEDLQKKVNSALLEIYKDKNKKVKVNNIQLSQTRYDIIYIIVLEIFEKEKIGF